ncbi:MAG TPA: beta-ketoacyl synthase chain length factor, partial [Variovorax sp.]|nr:beta-ketoacyl synthase chain length factor [Variovorax sp.]
AATPLQLPSPAMLPSHERRRASQAVRLALACISQALEASPFPVETLRSVFATDEGTGEVCQQMLETLGTTRQVSPLLFPNSVLNAPSGYFSIAWRNRQPTTALSMGLESFAAGLLCAVTESMASGEPVMLVAYDPAMPSPMNEVLPVEEATASTWIIRCGSPGEGVPVLGSFTLAVEPELRVPEPLPTWLPASWAGHSSARGLAALGLLDAEAGTACRLSLGAQLLTLRRTDGGTS